MSNIRYPSPRMYEAAEILCYVRLCHRYFALDFPIPLPASSSPPPHNAQTVTPSMSKVPSDITDASTSESFSSHTLSSYASGSCSQPVIHDIPAIRHERRTTRQRAKEASKPIKTGRAKAPRARNPKPNKKPHERIADLEKEPLIGKVSPHSVYCLKCKKDVALDARRPFYPGLWDKHKKNYHLPGGTNIKLFKPKRLVKARRHSE